jgi:UPF0755 protein
MLKLLFRASLAVLIVAITGAALGLSGWRRMHAPYKGFSAEERFVDIPAGAGSGEIRRRLIDAGVIEDETVFRAALWWSGASRRLKAGEYRFDRPMTPLEVIDVLDRGDVYTERITFPEGLTIREMAAIFEARGFGSAAEFESAAGDVSLIADLDPDARDLEGYLTKGCATRRRRSS